MRCEYCEIIEGKSKAEIIYEDDEVVAAIKDLVSIPGQITVFPKKHFTIMEMVPDNILQKCSQIANKVGVAIFESLGCQGTNIVVQNGTSAGQKAPHFSFEIIPRREGDGLNLQWEPKTLAEDEMDTTHLMLKEEGDKIVNVGKEVKEQAKEIKIEEKTLSEDGKDNYLIKSLKKIP